MTKLRVQVPSGKQVLITSKYEDGTEEGHVMANPTSEVMEAWFDLPSNGYVIVGPETDADAAAPELVQEA